MIVNKTMFSTSSAYYNIERMRQTFDDLQTQLATGKKAQTLSDMGGTRSTNIDLRHQLSLVNSFQDNITMVGTRLDVVDVVLQRLDTVESEVRSFAASDAAGENQINLTTAQSFARSHMDELVNLMNTNVAGRHMFAGSNTEQPPVKSMDILLNGEGGRDGFRTVVSERKAADAGAAGLGRLALSQNTNVVNIAEDGTHPFGFKLSGASTDSLGVNAGTVAGAPPALDITFNSPPNVGEKIFVTLTLPDGSSETLAFAATLSATPTADEYQVGATNDITAANFEAALQNKLLEKTTTTLNAASVFAAADNFFNGNGETIQRVDGPPFDSATALIAATSADTITWYEGSSSADPRKSVVARIADKANVGYGVEGNEKGFLELMRSVASVAVETFSLGDSTAGARYDALTDRQTDRLAENNNNRPGSIEVIAMELGVVRNTMGSYNDLNNGYINQVETVISGLEDAPIEEVAMRIQSLQVRLQASYQTMSIVSQLSMVNFIR